MRGRHNLHYDHCIISYLLLESPIIMSTGRCTLADLLTLHPINVRQKYWIGKSADPCQGHSHDWRFLWRRENRVKGTVEVVRGCDTFADVNTRGRCGRVLEWALSTLPRQEPLGSNGRRFVRSRRCQLGMRVAWYLKHMQESGTIPSYEEGNGSCDENWITQLQLT